MDKNYDVKIQFSKYFYFKMANLADIINTETIFMKTTPTDSKKKKKLAGLEYMYQNEICICIFLYNKVS